MNNVTNNCHCFGPPMQFIFFVHLTKQLNSTETAQFVKQSETFIQHMHKFPSILSLLWNPSIKVDFKYVDWI